MGPQKALIDCPIYEVLYGGARGGGKTDGVIGSRGLRAQQYGKAFNCVIFRKEMPQADDMWERAREIYGPLRAAFNETTKTIRFREGGRMRLRPLESVKDAEKYQGQNLTDACVEEAGNFPDPAPILRLHACMRSAAGVPTQILLTANPGGPGQQWIKRRYIDPCPQGMRPIIEEIRVNGGNRPDYTIRRERVFIPAKVWDNRIMLAKDPDYVGNLHMVGSEALVRAWLNGDWDVVEGAYFDCWHAGLVIRPCTLPDHWTRGTSFDWGSAKPFSHGWWAVASEHFIHPDGFLIPKGAIVRYREWYGAKKDDNGMTIPNVGLKLTAEQVAVGIAEREDEKIHYRVADPSIFAEDGGPSIAERMYKAAKIQFRPADNKRVPAHGHIGGWDQMRARQIGEDFSGHNRPMVYTFDTCLDSIRTIPALQHDELRPEDLDSDGEDHPADDWRYFHMSRPYRRPRPADLEAIRGMEGLNMEKLWKESAKRQESRI